MDQQLELRFWRSGSVRSVLTAYLDMKREAICGETAKDYRVRLLWLCEVLGATTPAVAVDFNALERVCREARGVLRDITIKRRLTFWVSAVKYAIMRKEVPKDALPELPPWLVDDTRRCEDYYTLSQYQEFRLAVPPGRYRRLADSSMWTGQHSVDLWTMQRQHLDTEYVWKDAEDKIIAIGRWWRRNNKNVRGRGGRPSKVQPCWVPMEPEFLVLAREWVNELRSPETLVVGRLNNVRRTFHEAAARAGLPPIRPNTGFRASFATMLLSRDYSYEYVRLALGHVGEVSAASRTDQSPRAATSSPTVLTGHYARSSPDILRPRAG